MKIQTVTNTNFKGYDARRLKGFFMGSNSHGIAQEMQSIGEKEGFKIYSYIRKGFGKFCEESIPKLMPFNTKYLWAQDLWTFRNDKLLSFINKYETVSITEFFKIPRLEQKNHISGGNLYIVNNNGKEEVLVGDADLYTLSVPEIKKYYNVDTVHPIPQMDYHLDLFIRPLDNNRILVADDNMTIQILEKGLEEFIAFAKNKNAQQNKIIDAIIQNFNKVITEFKQEVSENKLPQTEQVSNILEEIGYIPIRVPGRIYSATYFTDNDVYLSHDCNYINANVIKNENDEIIYITNKSNIDKTLGLENDFAKDFEFRFEKEFVKSLAPYVKPEKVYFIDGKDSFVSTTMLKEMQGGIHCACSEIPFELQKSDETFIKP